MRIDVLTLFPEIFTGFLNESILKLAIQRGLIELNVWNFRDWSRDKHHKVDDRPYGGGPGMVIKPEPVFEAVEAVQAMAEPPGRLLLLTPQGRPFTQEWAEELAREPRLLLLCGRYEGFDERIRIGLRPEELSIGDYVTCGGEAPAMVVIEAVMRLIPGALGDEYSPAEESFGRWGLLEYPHYTRPRVYRGMAVPEVLLSGDHAAIARWRLEQAVRRTMERRPDLIEKALRRPDCPPAVRQMIRQLQREHQQLTRNDAATKEAGDDSEGNRVR